MSTEQHDQTESADVQGDVQDDVQVPDDGRQPDWWHRDHPTFTALSGFFTGLAFVVVVPGLFIGLLNWLFADDTAEDLFPFVLVTLGVPIGLVIAPKTRRFGLYMLIGVVMTALVVLGVGGLVLWFMLTYQS
ncbi:MULTISPECIES: hypothetical protein [Nocardioides]|uniref:hypothetical protein n=1 Tax=Nocardioides TaxID=1839 RepID=UPI0018DF9199|nr:MULTISPECIES: hypothetical protein [unclassified Nocardioides]